MKTVAKTEVARRLGSGRRGWTGAEVWIFVSIGDAAGPREASLDEVIAAADSNEMGLRCTPSSPTRSESIPSGEATA
jgi:hypothetical protein